MPPDTLAVFYERDLLKLVEEINLFKNEEDLWITKGTIKNAAGNLALHIIGGTNYLIGTLLADTGYVRNRALEFSSKNVERKKITTELKALITLVKNTLGELTPLDMEELYPILFEGKEVNKGYVLVQFLAHLNYHIGQINYLRRMFE